METILTLHNVTVLYPEVERFAFYEAGGEDAESIPSFSGIVCTEDGKEYDFNRLLSKDEVDEWEWLAEELSRGRPLKSVTLQGDDPDLYEFVDYEA